MRQFIQIVEGVITESDTIRIGRHAAQRLKTRNQLLQLLKKKPALRGWATSDGDVWVWDAEAFTHSFMTRHIPFTEKPIYFWHPANAPDVEFEQNGGRDAVMDCGDFLFDVWSPGEADKKDFIASNDTLRRIISCS